MKNFNLMTLVAFLCVSDLCGCGGSDKGDKPTANAETELEGVETSVMDLPVEKRLELAKKYEFTYCFPDGLALVQLNGKCGFVDKSDKEVIPCVYDFAWGFSDGLARVGLNGKYGFIDKAGKQVIPCVYDGAWDFFDGLALVMMNAKWGLVDKSGKQVIPCVYDDAWEFYDGLARVWLNGKWGFIDKNGKEVIPCVYDNVYATAVDILVGTVKGSDGKKTKYYYDKNGDFLGN